MERLVSSSISTLPKTPSLLALLCESSLPERPLTQHQSLQHDGMLPGQRWLIALAAEYVHSSVRKYARCFVIVFPVALHSDPIKLSLESKGKSLNSSLNFTGGWSCFQIKHTSSYWDVYHSIDLLALLPSSHDANRFLRLSILSAAFLFQSLIYLFKWNLI